MAATLAIGFLGIMRKIIREVARWRIQTEIRLKKRTVPSLAIALVLGLMATAIMWALRAGQSQGLAACVMGIATFGGMFLITCIGAGVLLARTPEEIIEELLREPGRTFGNPWKAAQLAEAERCLTVRRVKRRDLLVRRP